MDRQVDAIVQQAFRPKARVLRAFGDELISSELVAVIELVKNAYDADATRVVVRFCEPLQVGRGAIEVIDNGNGMSLETIQRAWMVPATSTKKRQRTSEYLNRRVLGEKGIGRFAASRLADNLELITRRRGSDQELRALFDWTQFDDDDRYLDEVEVLWEETEAREIVPNGALRLLLDSEAETLDESMCHGTILRMEGLRIDWHREQLQEIHTGLSRLLLPFSQPRMPRIADTFNISLILPEQYFTLSGSIEPPSTLRNPHYSIAGTVDEVGRYSLKFGVMGEDSEDTITGTYQLPDAEPGTPRLPRCGPFDIELRVWDRDALGELASASGKTVKNVRQDLDRIAGINIYRDGFRVLPYGESKNDWLRLDLRRVQNPTLRLSNNQIVGYVLITADGNPELRDQTNREGIIEGPALADLRVLVINVLAELELRRHSLRRQETEPIRRGGIFAGFGLQDVRAAITKQYPEARGLLELVREKEEDLSRRVEQAQEVIARYRRLATMGQLVDVVLHDGRTPVAKIKNEAALGNRDARRMGSVAARLLGRFDLITAQTELLAGLFRRIEPFGGRKRGKPKEIYLEDAIADAFQLLATEIDQVDARVSLPPTKTPVTVDSAEIQEIMINLLTNSLYWLQEIDVSMRQILVEVQRKNADELEVVFSDSGPGVRPEAREFIFDPYFSTKPDGVGLGLAIAGEIVSEYYDGSLELLDKGPLTGATFRITLRRRVSDA